MAEGHGDGLNAAAEAPEASHMECVQRVKCTMPVGEPQMVVEKCVLAD